MDQDVEGNRDRMVPERSYDRLLLDEANHRVANELASALASLHLLRSARSAKASALLLGDAIDRLEGFASVHHILNERFGASVELSGVVDRLCSAVISARFTPFGSTLSLKLEKTWVDGETARRIVMIVYEVVLNALKHAFAARAGRLEVGLACTSGRILLSVVDDGPGIAMPRSTGGSGLGSGIIEDLARRCGGRIEYDSGPAGTAVRIMLAPGKAAIVGTDRDG